MEHALLCMYTFTKSKKEFKTVQPFQQDKYEIWIGPKQKNLMTRSRIGPKFSWPSHHVSAMALVSPALPLVYEPACAAEHRKRKENQLQHPIPTLTNQ